MFVSSSLTHQSAGNRLRRNLADIAVLSISFAAVLSTVGCGNQYRPVVSAIGPVGPAGQPEKFAVAVSNPCPASNPACGSPGLLTNVDFSGDTVLSTPQILTNPSYFQLNATGTQAVVINAEGGLDTIPLSNPGGLLTSQVIQTTLPVNSNPVSISSFSPASGLLTIFVPLAGTGYDNIAAINSGTAALYDTVDTKSGGTPVYVVGATNAPRVYAISQQPNGAGQVDAIETISTLTLSDSAQIPVGLNPIYGVMTTDDRRAFILNKGSGTVTVLNVPSNALDTLPPGIPSPAPGTLTVGSNPVWADLNTVNTQLVVLNQGVAGQPGSLSVINIPLCSSAAQPTNPNCSSTNPADAASFGTTLTTVPVPVGIHPTMVSVLQGTDGNAPAAYVINQADSTGTCADTNSGTVTIVNLQTDQVTATICGVSGANATAQANGTSNLIFGHPNSVSATGGEPTGKVYITSSDNQYLSVLYTDTNTVQAHIPLQGNGLRVLVTAP